MVPSLGCCHHEMQTRRRYRFCCQMLNSRSNGTWASFSFWRSHYFVSGLKRKTSGIAKGPRKTTIRSLNSVDLTFLFFAIKKQIKALINQVRNGIYAPMFYSLFISPTTKQYISLPASARSPGQGMPKKLVLIFNSDGNSDRFITRRPHSFYRTA